MKSQNNYKWYIASLSAFTGAFCVAAPTLALSVLFEEISSDLSLNLVQIGLIWSFGSLFSIFSGLLSGTLGDIFGPKRVIMFGAVILSISGAMRGMVDSFSAMLIVISIFGFATPVISVSAFKLNGIWFTKDQLGVANGIFGAGMAFGFLMGSLLSSTTLSPWLGGWQPVLIFYGCLSIIVSVLWNFTPSLPLRKDEYINSNGKFSASDTIFHVFKIRNVWLIGITLLGVSGGLQGITGYLPLYLRNQGWEIIAADGTLSLLNFLGMSAVIPLTIWSDRVSTRKTMLLVMIAIITIGTSLLILSGTTTVWAGVSLIGLVRDATIVLLMTMVFESDGIGPVYAGTANGLVMVLLMTGNFIAPPIGNKLAGIYPGLPFIFWTSLVFIGLICFLFVKNPQERSAAVNNFC